MLRERLNIYLACEELDFTWDDSEVEEFRRMWIFGSSLPNIAKRLKRDPDEVGILAIDQARKGLIRRRKGGAWGNGI